MPVTDTYVAFDTSVLNLLNEQAKEKGYSRTLSPALLRRLDPKGTHIVAFNFIHNDDHVRTTLAVKLVDHDNPATATLDMALETYMALPRVGRDDDGVIVQVDADGKEKKLKRNRR